MYDPHKCQDVLGFFVKVLRELELGLLGVIHGLLINLVHLTSCKLTEPIVVDVVDELFDFITVVAFPQPSNKSRLRLLHQLSYIGVELEDAGL